MGYDIHVGHVSACGHQEGAKNNNRKGYLDSAGTAGQIWFEVSHREWEKANIIGGSKKQII